MTLYNLHLSDHIYIRGTSFYIGQAGYWGRCCLEYSLSPVVLSSFNKIQRFWIDIHALSKVFVDLEPPLIDANGSCTVRERGWMERKRELSVS